MEQIKGIYICKYCLGCNAEETDDFKPKKSCKNFIQAYENWQEDFYKEISKANKNI